MKKTKALSILLSLSMLASTIIPGTLALQTYADEKPKGMEISKTATPNEDGTYTITLEAYATGEKISTEVTRDVPTDIVLVLDQSGSMDTKDFPSVGETLYNAYSGSETKNSNLYSKRHNNNGKDGNLYYKLSDGSYATVSVTRTQGEGNVSYTQCSKSWSNEKYYEKKDNDSNLFILVGNEYKPVKITRQFYLLDGMKYVYTYTFPDGSVVTSERNDTVPNLGNRGSLFYKTTTAGEYIYTYTCTDTEGNTINIGTSTGGDTQFTAKTLYKKSVTTGGNIKRIQALKDAVAGFTNAVAEKAKGKDGQLGTSDDINHRIAVVGFASGQKYNGTNYNYGNTEVFVGSTQYKYGDSAKGQYRNAFQNMDTSQGRTRVNDSINALDADGGTIVNLGMEMANGILNANPVPQGEKRNRVVIVFTDGIPGWSGYDSNVATNAINEADTARKTYNATVYTVGIFEGADATSPGSQTGKDDTKKANWFMQNLSDNKGIVQTPSYYLSAADSNTLNNIFQQISDQIQEGGSAIDLGSEAVIKDIISPQFQLPKNADASSIKLETYKCIGENRWERNTGAMGATATINNDQVSVTGFDFKENWCGTETVSGNETYRGNKLVISFPVEAKEGFLGGNGVYTNTSAGVYENAQEKDPLFTFEKPQVDVAIKDVTVTPENKNVYLMGDLTADQIKAGATVKSGNVNINLDPTVKNYGLESWQNEYVNITVTYKDAQGNTVTNLNDLREDTTYTVEVKVTPKSANGAAVEKTGTGNGNIYVFEPELTYKDSEAYYGDTAPTNFKGNLVSTVWKHGNALASATTMIGTEPELKFDYKPENADAIADGKIATKKDIKVNVDVRVDGMSADESLNDSVVFKHQNCKSGCDWTTPNPNNGNPAFLIHVKTCQLTITKTGGESGEPYVFDIYKDDGKEIYSQITIVGNGSETIVELPVGSYTIQEDEGWSWRYDSTVTGNGNLSAAIPTGTLTCTNVKNNDYWFNDYTDVRTNTSGKANN